MSFRNVYQIPSWCDKSVLYLTYAYTWPSECECKYHKKKRLWEVPGPSHASAVDTSFPFKPSCAV
ncbi:hypothetical protein BDN70DRAFT_881684 [Pholiota conissans]|uniref:Uncharacterized protein n=1 Tax=Pholiota conissans TaxID=109636 RepID=A0A9P5YWB4_9AGAR|nr:hypothetical protein BDN70DRAFT_881684 [Pholiota conissans]